MSENGVSVLYIGGWGRSGSTLVGNVLNEVEGFIHVGELRNIWENGLLYDRMCGCRSRFSECSFWQSVLAEAFKDPAAIDAGHHIRMRDALPGNRELMTSLLLRREIPSDRFTAYASVLDRLYAAIARVSGAKVIVDSSKFPSHAYALSAAPQVDLKLLHLIRDCRASAYSWSRTVARADVDGTRTMAMETFTPASSTARWVLWNTMLELMPRRLHMDYLQLRYEDFAAQPRRETRDILRFAGRSTSDLPFVDEHRVQVGSNHTIWGNPSRITTGLIQIRNDNRWKSRLPKRTAMQVNLMALPWMFRYGYLRRGATNGAAP